jgi:3,4-dihydroxy 2-butanone 4-phosphate synthase/GTP cyclohydrolase II
MPLSTIEEGIRELKKGNLIIVVDNEDRENEGDFVLAAEKATPAKINFMIKKGGGVVCVPIIRKRLDELKIPLMVENKNNSGKMGCKFTISIDFKEVGSGISAFDRCKTIKELTNSSARAEDFNRPGHIFPLRYQEGGVLKRDGHTEAGVDLCKLAGLYPAAVLCEILKEDGNTAKREDLEKLAKEHNLKIISIKDIIKHIKQV